MSGREARTHSLERTNLKGVPFVGRCTLCGKEGLRMGQALEPCANWRGLTEDEALLEAISGRTEER